MGKRGPSGHPVDRVRAGERRTGNYMKVLVTLIGAFAAILIYVSISHG